jgi:hypothetical protein
MASGGPRKHIMKFIIGLILMAGAACSSSAGSTDKDPIVGHWTFIQLTVNHPASVMYASAPNLCIGDLDINEDGTWAGWNVCKNDNAVDRTAGSFSGTWVKVSRYHYRANNGDYDIILSKDGTTGFYGSMTTTNPNLVGHYEYGQILKDVVVDHAELQ